MLNILEGVAIYCIRSMMKQKPSNKELADFRLYYLNQLGMLLDDSRRLRRFYNE